MSGEAMAALRAESERAAGLARDLTDDEWARASGCDGWRVQDVLCHMACVWHSVTEPESIEQGPPDDAEASAEVPVQARRSWAPAQVLEEYEAWAPRGLAAMAALQDAPMADTVVPLGNLGAHPLHLLANALVFDHYCHLRHDIGVAVPRAAQLPRSEEALVAARQWMLAGLPQMCAPGLRQAVSAPVTLVFDGPGGGAWTLLPAGDDGLCEVVDAVGDAAATATSTVHDFIAWGTKRGDWRATVSITGDATLASHVLDAVNVI